MTYFTRNIRTERKKKTRNNLGTIAAASVFLFAISAVGPANAAPALDVPPTTATAKTTNDISQKTQSLTVSIDAAPIKIVRDSMQATSEEELAQIVIAQQQAEAIANTSYGTNSLVAGIAPDQVIPADGIIAAAQQWVGVVPYGHGNHPSDSFSCDGYVQYVFSQNGISLPRGADAQANLGTRISQSEAKAGDLVWWPGQHIGIYDGSGGMYDSPMPGRNVQHRVGSLWGNPVFIRM